MISTARRVQQLLPPGGLFHEKQWRIAQSPFRLPEALADDLSKLGYRLTLFLRACDHLYRQSVKGRQPEWIAQLLDRGKPAELVSFQRANGKAGEIPQVIRPDLILTEDGFTIAEIDSVPGGIGLTAWLNATYSALGHPVLGGASGMLNGFASILPGGDIVVSEEASTYRPEMHWLATALGEAFPGQRWRIRTGDEKGDWARTVYRFFELFDLPNIPCAKDLLEAVARGEVRLTAPVKPALEEKLWFALFWLQPLAEFWRRELGEKAFLALRRVIPYTWLVDPTPLPPHGVLPRLEVNSWEDVARFSQKKRNLVLKISGFSELAWGSRGVVVGSDLPQREWEQSIRDAVSQAEKAPRILQEFHTGKLFETAFLDPASDAESSMRGRVRLCPYFFSTGSEVSCGGALATICPPDKKLLHGMRDAVLAPVAQFTSE